jgi:uncharacterized membrane protein
MKIQAFAYWNHGVTMMQAEAGVPPVQSLQVEIGIFAMHSPTILAESPLFMFETIFA